MTQKYEPVRSSVPVAYYVEDTKHHATVEKQSGLRFKCKKNFLTKTWNFTAAPFITYN